LTEAPTADRTLDTGGGAPAPTHWAYTRDTTVHARRTTQHHSRSTAPAAAGCARDTATVTTVSPDERQSETDSARRPGKRHMRTAHTSHMRHARKDDLCMPQADHFHVCRMAQNAHKPIGHGPCGKPSSFAASRGPPRSTHREMRLPPRPGLELHFSHLRGRRERLLEVRRRP